MTEEHQALLRHAIQKTLVICSILARDDTRGNLALVGQDAALTERACKLILNQMLRELVQPDPNELQRLVSQLAALADEL